MARSVRWVMSFAAAAVAVCLGASTAASAAPSAAATRTYTSPVSIRSTVNPTMAAAVLGNSVRNGAPIALWTWFDGANEKFTQIGRGAGYVNFRALHSGRCLRVDGASTANGAAIVQWTCGDRGEDWKPVDFGDGYRLVARHSGKCLDVLGGVAKGHRLVQNPCTRAASQRWFLRIEV